MKESVLWLGFEFAMGTIMAVGALIAVITVIQLSLAKPPNDDSDPQGERSNMRVYTDALTGCQYLRGPAGGITPRLRPDGTQVCKEPA